LKMKDADSVEVSAFFYSYFSIVPKRQAYASV
jgi:hypothetical protein